MFKHLQIPEKLVREAGIFRVTSKEAPSHGFKFGKSGADLSGIVFPYRDPSGQVKNGRIRRDRPETDNNGKPENKYLSTPLKPRLLYLPPGATRAMRDKDSAFVIVESEKAALALTAAAERLKQPIVVVATGGCWGWRAKVQNSSSGEQTETMSAPLSDLRLMQGREVIICFDSNVATNEAVKKAEKALALYLAGTLQARVKCARIPGMDGVNGPDDYLRSEGDRAIWKILENADQPWCDAFASYEKIMMAAPAQFVVSNLIQAQTATFV